MSDYRTYGPRPLPQCRVVGHYEESPGNGWREQCELPPQHEGQYKGESGTLRPPWLDTGA